MKKWKCPGCGDETEALASFVAHRCPRSRNRYLYYEEVKDDSVPGKSE